MANRPQTDQQVSLTAKTTTLHRSRPSHTSANADSPPPVWWENCSPHETLSALPPVRCLPHSSTRPHLASSCRRAANNRSPESRQANRDALPQNRTNTHRWTLPAFPVEQSDSCPSCSSIADGNSDLMDDRCLQKNARGLPTAAAKTPARRQYDSQSPASRRVAHPDELCRAHRCYL